jgi:hypothetical protein
MLKTVDRVLVIGLAPLLVGALLVLWGTLSLGWAGFLAGLGAAVLLSKGLSVFGNMRVSSFYKRNQAQLEQKALALQAARCVLERVEELSLQERQALLLEQDLPVGFDPSCYPRSLALTFVLSPASPDTEWKLEGIQLESCIDSDLLNDREDPVRAGWGLWQPLTRSITIVRQASGASLIHKPHLDSPVKGQQTLRIALLLGQRVRDLELSYYTKKLLALALPSQPQMSSSSNEP